MVGNGGYGLEEDVVGSDYDAEEFTSNGGNEDGNDWEDVHVGDEDTDAEVLDVVVESGGDEGSYEGEDTNANSEDGDDEEEGVDDDEGEGGDGDEDDDDAVAGYVFITRGGVMWQGGEGNLQFASGDDLTESGWEYNICCIDCVSLFVSITQFAMDMDCLSLLIVYCFFNLLANGLNNSQHYWANNVGSCCVRFHVANSLTGFKLCATTLNNTEQHATAAGCANERNM